MSVVKELRGQLVSSMTINIVQRARVLPLIAEYRRSNKHADVCRVFRSRLRSRKVRSEELPAIRSQGPRRISVSISSRQIPSTSLYRRNSRDTLHALRVQENFNLNQMLANIDNPRPSHGIGPLQSHAAERDIALAPGRKCDDFESHDER